MGIITKIWTAVRGHATEAGEAIIDSNALTILDQEMRDADAELRRSKDSLTEVMAKRKVASDKLLDKKAKAKEYEGYVQAALSKNDEALATEVAGRLRDQGIEVHELEQGWDSLEDDPAVATLASYLAIAGWSPR